MSYDTHLDRLYTGDMSGIARIVRKVTGVSYEDTDAGTTALGNGSFRMRSDSTASFAGDAAGAGGGMGGATGPGAADEDDDRKREGTDPEPTL